MGGTIFFLPGPHIHLIGIALTTVGPYKQKYPQDWQRCVPLMPGEVPPATGIMCHLCQDSPRKPEKSILYEMYLLLSTEKSCTHLWWL